MTGESARTWSVLVSADRFAAERLYRHEMLELDGLSRSAAIAPGDQVALVADVDPPIVFALARVAVPARGNADDPGADQAEAVDGTLLLAYTHRFFDDPRPAPRGGPITALSPDVFRELASVRPVLQRTWLVSLDMPIEAATPAEAARQFWTYVHDLGPAELPVFVSPTDDELAMQAFVLGAEANQDPEE